jgi:hypothetical protein
MIEATSTTETDDNQARQWSQQLQRRVIRLLFQHGEALFRNQFGQFSAQSALPQIPLLQQYDRYIKLHILSDELLDDILPRIRRQLSLKTSRARLHEEAPTRGDIDWPRTLEQSNSQSPGLPPIQFETRLRQRSMETPENLLTVAILLAYRQELQQAMKDRFEDEDLSALEMQTLTSADERAERELAAPFARSLMQQASKADINALAQAVDAHLRPGPSPYRALIAWWRRFTTFRVGRATSEQLHPFASKRTDEKSDAWLYELWIALEYIHLFSQAGALLAQDMVIATDWLQCTFTWQQRRFRFIYNRQLDTSTTYESDWEHGPSTRPDYSIEREKPLEIRHEETLIWREPPVVFDAKYYLGGSDPTNTHGPIKKLLGDMTLVGSHTAALFFPQLPEPQTKEQTITRTIQRTGQRYQPGGESVQQVYLYHLEPTMPFENVQKRLRSTLDLAAQALPDRPKPTCQGVWLDPDSVNADHHILPAHTVLCPKPHIGANVFDLVNADTDCLKNPRLCHVIGQPIIAPFVVRVTTSEQLTQQSQTIRSRSDEMLYKVEQLGDEAQAERIREYIFAGVGRTVEQYVKQFGNTVAIEDHFEQWVFGPYWQQHQRSLSQEARNSLVSGEFVWQHYQDVSLQDWAAPAIQYCRALELELKRRFYQPCPEKYPPLRAGFTLGTLIYAYTRQQSDRNAKLTWDIFIDLVAQAGSNIQDFEHIVQRMLVDQIKDKRNLLAHGGAISKEIASVLRDTVIGSRNKPGILCWLAEYVAPA